MKKIIFLFLITCSILTSCATMSAQVYDSTTGIEITVSDYTYNDVYLYNSVWCPVIYVNTIPYYIYNNIWYVIAHDYRHHIHHFDVARTCRAPYFYNVYNHHDRVHFGNHFRQHVSPHRNNILRYNRPQVNHNGNHRPTVRPNQNTRQHFREVRPSSTRTTVNRPQINRQTFNRGTTTRTHQFNHRR